ncbi:30S ribosomal protein S1 [Listeria grayi FSL F6-1183]|uniref:30S ribosomal protein S1 n=1 Tax=Listeria grayi FSL F6-1183 TaxID=1265827 RepID=A0A829R5Y6_LISGR|nr:30S ribosomal protein S1 [Listeria grayi FSL F6-1183]
MEVKVLDVNLDEKRLSLSIKALQEDPDAEPEYELPEESTGFQMSDIIGDQLKNIQNKENE